MENDLDAYLVSPEAIDETASAEGRLLKPGETFDGLRTIAFLGRGATSEVWRMHDESLHADCAIKIFSGAGLPAAKERFLAEARLLAQFNHPNIVHVKRLSETGDHPYFTMDLLRPLPAKLSDKDAANIITDVLEALDALHSKNILHRDIKPSNVLLDESGRAVLTDLGTAHIDNAEIASKVQSHNAHNLTIADGSAAAIGTPGFGAPEQFAGGDISPATDIHALGVFVYSLFDGKLPVLWRGTVRRMTSAVPALRFQSVADIRRSLKRLRLLTTTMKVFALAGLCGILSITAFLFSPNWEELTFIDNITDKKFFSVDGWCTNFYPCITLRDGKNYVMPKVMRSGWRQNPGSEWKTVSGKWQPVKYRRRLDIEGSGVLKCPVITATEVHLAPGVTLVTSGRYTPEETNELINAVFVVADGANLIFEN